MVDRNPQSGQMLIAPRLVKAEYKEYFFKTLDLLAFSVNKDNV